MNTVFVFGNPDLAMDALPVRMLPKLREKFPEVEFHLLDPNEEWEIPKDLIVLDTVIGINEVTVFDDLTHFADSARVSMHDFDAYSNLRFLQKLGKLEHITIIGIPPLEGDLDMLTQNTIRLLTSLLTGKDR